MTKKPAFVAIPPGVVTLIIPPLLGLVPTTAVMEVALLMIKEVAAAPPKFTALAPVKLVPVIVTEVPAVPKDGVKEVMVGAAASEKPREENNPLP